MRIVIDTDVMLAAFRSPDGASRAWLGLALDGEPEVTCSVPLFLEYEAVLKRPIHLAATGLVKEDIDLFLDDFSTRIRPVEFHYRFRPSANDPADEMVIETAVNGDADLVLSFNERHLSAPCRRHGIRVSRPGPALKQWRLDHGPLCP